MERIARGDLTKKLKDDKVKIVKDLIIYTNSF
ncbi:MAG TPA: hypothetical protein DCM59_10820, partial [Clostridium sp.]|nr:hypothetical protein [Clostridium sp.]